MPSDEENFMLVILRFIQPRKDLVSRKWFEGMTSPVSCFNREFGKFEKEINLIVGINEQQ